MADEEHVGGIGVSATVDLGGLDRDLAAMLAKMQKAADQAQGILNGVNARVSSTQQTSARSGGSGSNQPARVTIDTTKLEAKIEGLGGKITELIAALGRLNLSGAGAATRGQRPDTSVEDSISQYPPHMQAQIRAAMGTARMPGETRPAESYRPAQQVQAQRVAIVTDKPIQVVTSQQERTYQQGQDAKRRTRKVVDEGEDAVEAPRAPRRKMLRDQGIGTEARADTIYTYDPEVYAEQDRRKEAKAANQREQYVSRQGAVETKPSPAEERLLRSLFPDAATREQERQRERDVLEALTASAASASQQPGVTRAPLYSETGNAPGPVDVGRRVPRAGTRMASEGQPRVAYQTPAEARAAARGGTGRVYGGQGLSDEEIERRANLARIRRESDLVSAGRTQRTQASALGGFAFGGGRERIQAEANMTAAIQKRQLAERELRESEARAADPAVRSDPVARRHATEELTAARNKLNRTYDEEAKAIKKVESFSGPVAAAKNLLAISAAGAAFGLGIKAFDFAMSAAVPAVQRMIDAQMGFMATSTRVTGELGKQTIAFRGNVDAALAAAEAQAGLSASSAALLNESLRLPTQIKAGAQAQTSASDLIRAAAGGSMEGLIGGYGGVGGSAFLGQQLGGGKGYFESIGEDARALQDIIRQGQGTTQTNIFKNGPFGLLTAPFQGQTLEQATQEYVPATQEQIDKATQATQALEAMLTSANDAAARGAQVLGQQPTGLSFQPGSGSEMSAFVAAARQISNEAGTFASQIASAGYVVKDASGNVVQFSDALMQFITQSAVGTGVTDPAMLGETSRATERLRQMESIASAARGPNGEPSAIEMRQRFELPAIMDAIERQFSRQVSVVNPAMAALSNLAAPPTPVGTGIVTRNAGEQSRVNDELSRAAELQDTLNAYYERGYDILRDTYQIPAPLLSQIGAIGQEIAATQANIANQQAQYQVAQINYQLHIARRTLSDIGGLTGHNFGAGQSYLGVLERQNLALSRQAQILQFSLAQRQINFNLAVAGFQVPGLTPAEQNARVTEAKKEAEFAQKQLDIQKQMFRNQVKIVDIQNLRAGRDLAAQIGLMLQGRNLVLDTAAAEQKLQRLQKTQQALMADAEAYISKTDARVAAAEKAITEIAMAAGRELTQLEKQGIAMAYKVGRAFFIGATGGFLGGGNSPTSGGGGEGGTGGGRGGKNIAASGALFTTGTATDWTFGEAGRETVAILRNPRTGSAPAMAASTGGGGDTYVTFGDVTVRSQSDIDDIVRKITRAQGRDAALRGLRSPN